MAEMFTTLGTWNWLIFGFILMALELTAPGVFLFWLGLAALLVGSVSFAINPSWQAQLLMFAVFTAAAVPAWRYFARSASSHSTSNPCSFAQKGAVAALTGPQDHLKSWLAEYAKRRSYAHQRLSSIPGITCVNAKGAFYLFPNI